MFYNLQFAIVNKKVISTIQFFKINLLIIVYSVFHCKMHTRSYHQNFLFHIIIYCVCD